MYVAYGSAPAAATVGNDELQINTVDGSADAKSTVAQQQVAEADELVSATVDTSKSEVLAVPATELYAKTPNDTNATESQPLEQVEPKVEKVIAEISTEPQITTADTTDSVDVKPSAVSESKVVVESETVPAPAIADVVVADVKLATTEAMDVEDSSSNDVEMQDVSVTEHSGSAEAEPSQEKPVTVEELSSTATTTNAVEEKPNVDVPDSKTDATPDSVTNAKVEKPEPAPEKIDAPEATQSDVVPVVESSVPATTIDSEYQDVEKNISNLFNDESLEITSSSSVAEKVDTLPSENKNADRIESVPLPTNNGADCGDADLAAKSLVSILEDIPAKDDVPKAVVASTTATNATDDAIASDEKLIGKGVENGTTVSTSTNQLHTEVTDSEKSSNTNKIADGNVESSGKYCIISIYLNMT